MNCFDRDPHLRWLFCPTHPDDELAICCWMKRLTDQGNDVFISWTHATEERMQEAQQAAQRLGVRQDRLFFHSGRDGQVCEQLAELTPSFESMVAEVQPDRITCGAFEQGHLDHDATNWLVNRVFRGPVLEFPLYHTYLSKLQTLNRFASPDGEEVVELDEDERRFKVDLAKRYPSQNIWTVLLAYECWQVLRLRPAELRKSERLRLQVHRDWNVPNLPDPLAGQVERSEPWLRWLRALHLVAEGDLHNS